MPLFQEHEISDEYQLFKDRLPTINDGLKFVLSRKGSIPDHNACVREFSKKVLKLWESADCCPQSLRRICQLFDNIYSKYVSYLKKSTNTNHRKRVSSSYPAAEPSRKSKRAPSKVGLHVTVPFMSMLLDYKSTQRELLEILPSYIQIC